MKNLMTGVVLSVAMLSGCDTEGLVKVVFPEISISMNGDIVLPKGEVSAFLGEHVTPELMLKALGGVNNGYEVNGNVMTWASSAGDTAPLGCEAVEHVLWNLDCSKLQALRGGDA